MKNRKRRTVSWVFSFVITELRRTADNPRDAKYVSTVPNQKLVDDRIQVARDALHGLEKV